MKSSNLVLDILSNNNFPSVLFEFLLLLEEFSEWSSVPDWNLLLRAIKSSFEGGVYLSAMVKASKAGSLSFKDTCLVTISVSFFSHVKNLHHHHWNVLKLFLDCDNFHVPIICSLIVLSGYYLLSCFCCCCFKVHMEIPINGCKLFACFVNFVTVTQVW